MDFLYDKMPYILTAGCVVAASLLFSCSVIGRVLHDDAITNKIISEENAAEIKKRLEQKRYEESFYDELEALKNIDLTKSDMEKLSKHYITEDTPIGKVKMCYSCDTETFWYYSKNKHIHYPILDAVARRYAVEHNCSQICLNYRKEVENINKKMHDESSVPDEDESKADIPTVYVKFKSYNKKNNSKKKLVTVERSNRFTYKGDIEENDKIKDNEQCVMNKISFAEYKKILETDNNNLDKIKTC